MSVSFFNRFNDLRRGGIIYPSPFFDIAQTYMPPTVKELFKWAKLYFYTHFAIRPVIVKLAAYPITDLIYTGDDALVKKWKYILDDLLNIKSHFINCGLDLNAMGNSITSMYFPFQRWLKCKHCQQSNLLDNMKEWTFKDLKWKGICLSCNDPGEFDAEDKYVRDIKKVNLIRWSIENIDIKFHEITGKAWYYYTIPQRVRKAILSNDKQVIAETPLNFIQAVKEDKAIELHPDNVFHMKQVTLAEEDQGYGKPIILSAMRDAFYLQILRKANEAIAFQYIVPLTVIYPEANGSLDPYRHVNLAEWRSRVEEEILKWKDDQNYIPIMPIPMGYKEIFGNAKALMVTPEIRAVTEQIITGMGVPQEFVFGGMQWTGSHVSLRMIENQLLRHREQMTRMLSFIIDRISRFFKLAKIDIKFADFKMADDIQLKQMLGNLVSAQKLSLQSYIQEFGYNLENEQKQVLKETEFTNKLQKMQLMAQAEAQSEALMVSSRAQTKAQIESQKQMQKEQKSDVIQQLQGALALQREQATQQQAAQPQQGQQPQQAEAPPPAEEKPPQPGQALQGGLEVPAGSKGDSGEPHEMKFVDTPMDPRFIARQLAVQLNTTDPQKQEMFLHRMQSDMPNLYQLVTAQKSLLSQHKAQMPVDKPMPEVKPPRRKGKLK
jgi:hypothetical protein